MIRVAAVGDLHLDAKGAGSLRPHLENVSDRADVLLIAGDLTRRGTRVGPLRFDSGNVPAIPGLNNDPANAFTSKAELMSYLHSRRSGILLITDALKYISTFVLIARIEPDSWVAAAFGLIPLAVGIGYFVDATLIRRDLHTS